MDFKRVKKRYIVGAVVIVFLLWRCTDHDEQDYSQLRQERAADDARALANQEAASLGQPEPYAPAPQQPIIVNTPPQESHDHFWDYMMMHTILNHSQQQASYQPRYQARERNVTNITNVTNVRQRAPKTPAPAAPKTYDAPVKQPSSKWALPSATARSYTVSAPPASSMKTKTWATTPSKGWGSSTSYKSTSTSYKSSGYRASSGRRR
ncbi:hypothetical protein GJ904_17625 [Salmonella enterica]|nr:hypothetical protein [Salmonella enterica subsp. enterica serovar Saintpaul]EEC1302892.1 hypothetical protein [Salmonella enterica]